jgi:hypothetical protein
MGLGRQGTNSAGQLHKPIPENLHGEKQQRTHSK